MTIELSTAAVSEQERLAAVRRYAILDSPPDGAFERVCALAARFFDVPFASVTIVDEERIWFKAAQGLDAVEIARLPGLCASAILQDEPYVVTSALDDPRTTGNPLVHGEMGVRFYAASPITTSDGFRLGTVNVIGTEPRAITERETQTLRDLAAIVMDEIELRLAAIREVAREQARSALASADHQRAMELARTLQRSLSPPRLPTVEGLDVAVRYEPYAAEDVGGDFYDHFPIGQGRSGFFLGDVCGKGAEAAAVTSLARYTMRTAAMLNEDPWAILADLNAALRMEGGRAMQTCTVVYGQIDTTGGAASVRLAVAGHPAPLVVRGNADVEVTAAHGTILGAFPDPAFHTCAVTLAPGDAIVVYSDGVLDLQSHRAELDERRIARTLADASPATAQALVDRLWQAVHDTGELRDDVAIMALRLCATRD